VLSPEEFDLLLVFFRARFTDCKTISGHDFPKFKKNQRETIPQPVEAPLSSSAPYSEIDFRLVGRTSRLEASRLQPYCFDGSRWWKKASSRLIKTWKSKNYRGCLGIDCSVSSNYGEERTPRTTYTLSRYYT